jgi:hypothetical protein
MVGPSSKLFTFELSFFAYVMLEGGIATQTSQVQFHTHASLFEHSEQVEVSKYQPIPSYTFVSLSIFDLMSLSLLL